MMTTRETKIHYNCESCGAKQSIPEETTFIQKLPRYGVKMGTCVVCGTTVTLCCVDDNGNPLEATGA